MGVDIGGTKISAALVTEDGKLHRLTTVPTPDAGQVEKTVISLVRPLLGEGPSAVGLSVAGFVSHDGRSLIFSPNIPGWADPALGPTIASALDRPVTVENDGNAAAWAEAIYGAGRGIRDLVCLTVGTGLGGGLILGGQLQRGAWGFAAEFGHLTLVAQGRECTCGLRGCWETYVSGGALAREAASLAVSSPENASTLLTMAAGDASAISGNMVMAAALAGDRAALAAYEAVGTCLGWGIANLAAILDPQKVVIGGGVSSGGELLLEPARAAYERMLTGRAYRDLAAIEPALLGPEAGIVGAADLARRSAPTPE